MELFFQQEPPQNLKAEVQQVTLGKPQAPAKTIAVSFTNVRAAAGITFKQDATATNEKYHLETMGTGVGWIDYDQDGLLDFYPVQSAATRICTPPQPLRPALYHNNGDGTFIDVTENPAWRTKVAGQPAQRGLIMTGTVGSIW